MKAQDLFSTLRVGLAEAIAETVLGGVRQCALEGIPLTDNQQDTILRNALLAYRSRAAELEEAVTLDLKIFGRGEADAATG